MPTEDDDATIRLPSAMVARAPARAPTRRRLGLWLGLGGAFLAVGGGGALWRWGEETPEAPQPEAAAPPPPQGPPLLDLSGIAAHRAGVPTALRWSANPLVWVLDFPSLELQGQAMNRAAALMEKANTPRDRVLDDAALAAAIAADRRSAADWYFGHNYRASDLRRMFALAERDNIRLNPLELWLREQVDLAQRMDRARDAAILTIPATGPHVDEAMRRSILIHELAHGQFFTLPFFANHVMRIWETGFTEAERTAVRRFLHAEGYDAAQEEVMANEAMAYLLYTPDRRFFDPARDLGWSEAQAERLRALLRAGAPDAP